jgi:hypothetical protein
MALATGTPLGTIVSQEETYIEGAPYIYFQDNRANPLFNPDAQGYYYGLSGTSSYNVINLGCIQDVQLTEGVTMNDVRCDTIGVKDTIQKRDYVEFNLKILSQLPLTVLRHVMALGTAPSTGTGYETAGIGRIDNAQRYMVYAPAVYNQSAAGWLLFHLHRAKFVDAWTLDMKYGASWELTGLKIRAYADDTKPAEQIFGVIKRIDLAALP